MLTFRLAVVHSLPSAIRLEDAIAPDRVWSFAEPCVEPAPPTVPNAILRAIAAALIRLVVMVQGQEQHVMMGQERVEVHPNHAVAGWMARVSV